MIPVKIFITRTDRHEDDDREIQVESYMPCIPNAEDVITVTHPECVGDDELSAERISIEVKFSFYYFDLNNNFSHVEIYGDEG